MNDDISCHKHYAGDGDITAKKAAKSMMHGIYIPAYVSAWWFNAFKYLWRWFRKNGLQDLYKARESLDNLIDAVKEMWSE